MAWLPDAEKILKICLFVLTESTNVTDGRTQHDGRGHARIASCGKNLISVKHLECTNSH